MKTIKIILILLILLVATVGIHYWIYSKMDEPIPDEVVSELHVTFPFHIATSVEQISLHNSKGEHISEIIDTVRNRAYNIYIMKECIYWIEENWRNDVYKIGLSPLAEDLGVTVRYEKDKTVFEYGNYHADFLYGLDYMDSIYKVVDSVRTDYKKKVKEKHDAYFMRKCNIN